MMELENVKYNLVNKIKTAFNDKWKCDIVIFTSAVLNKIYGKNNNVS
jgi:hypothetical protein